MSGAQQVYLLLGLLWAVASLSGGALLALIARRIHPAWPYPKLWLVYSLILGVSTAVLFAIGIF